jgi:hypothetical protein
MKKTTSTRGILAMINRPGGAIAIDGPKQGEAFINGGHEFLKKISRITTATSKRRTPGSPMFIYYRGLFNRDDDGNWTGEADAAFRADYEEGKFK